MQLNKSIVAVWPDGFITFDSWELAYLKYIGIAPNPNPKEFNADVLKTSEAKSFREAYELGFADAAELYY